MVAIKKNARAGMSVVNPAVVQRNPIVMGKTQEIDRMMVEISGVMNSAAIGTEVAKTIVRTTATVNLLRAPNVQSRVVQKKPGTDPVKRNSLNKEKNSLNKEQRTNEIREIGNEASKKVAADRRRL